MKSISSFTRKVLLAGAAMLLAANAAKAEDVVLRVGVPQAFGYFAALWQKDVQLPGVKVEYKYFPNGADLNDAILSGAVDIEDQGEIGPIQMSANGSKNKVVACTGPNGRNTNLIVRPEVKATSFADLKGKRLAIAQNNNHKLFLVHLQKAHGLTDADITQINVSGAEAVTAFATGQVDATSQNSPTAAQILERVPGSYVLARADQYGISNLYCVFATPNAVEAKAEAIRAFIREYEKTIKWAKANPEEYVKLVTPKLGVSENAVRTALNNNSDGLAVIDETFLAEKQVYADEIFETGLIRRKLDVRDLFITDFNDAIADPVKPEVNQ